MKRFYAMANEQEHILNKLNVINLSLCFPLESSLAFHGKIETHFKIHFTWQNFVFSQFCVEFQTESMYILCSNEYFMLFQLKNLTWLLIMSNYN